MGKERIRKIAKRFEVPIDDVIGALARLGHPRYRLPDDLLPESVVAELEHALKRARAAAPPPASRPRMVIPTPARDARSPEPKLPDAIPDDPVLNAALQEYRSARSLADLRKTLPPQPGGLVKETVTAPLSKEEILRDSLGAEIHRRRMLSEALEEARAELSRLQAVSSTREHQLSTEVEHLRKELGVAQNGLGAAVTAMRLELEQAEQGEQRVRRDLEATRARLVEEVVNRQVLEARLSQLERKLHELESRPEPSRAPQVAPTAPLDELFEQRGLTGPNEVRTAMEALLREPGYFDTMEILCTSSPSVLKNHLRRKLAIVCENCEATGGAIGVRVEDPSRCEVCHGSSTGQAAQSFLAACKTWDIARVNVVGGSPRYINELRQLVGAMIELRGIDGTVALDSRRARQHVEGADLTLVWGGSILDHKVSNLYTDLDDRRVVQVPHRGIGGMLRMATEAIERRFGKSGNGRSRNA